MLELLDTTMLVTNVLVDKTVLEILLPPVGEIVVDDTIEMEELDNDVVVPADDVTDVVEDALVEFTELLDTDVAVDKTSEVVESPDIMDVADVVVNVDVREVTDVTVAVDDAVLDVVVPPPMGPSLSISAEKKLSGRVLLMRS